ncbi:NF-kappa-B inhibitor alpha-like isoform X2 [Mercenaria mercenaria]|nr:NF-kappa-B inhibitor alpha-like isoform X2 [Mercenaria mercenaria]XP_045181143.2 NF-kappa-B inhibitor alpha-like isoform X2 [Mercenaria mercenaria]XP_045181144.2 NF-kappa-B inhibitor alpha-like isoform X2 [Mercenaria mercenaria]
MAENIVKRNNLSSDDDVEADGEPCNVARAGIFNMMSDTHTKITSDSKTRTDGEPCNVARAGIFNMMSDTHTKITSDSKTRTQSDRHSEQIDSGILSMPSGSLELKSSNAETSLSFADKTPVQCSDAYEADSTANDLQSKLSKLGLSDGVDDEGHCSMSLQSLDSVSSAQSTQESQEIEIDLYRRDEDGDTILHVAIVSLLDETAGALIHLADDAKCLNIQNYLLQSPLHLSVLTGQVEIVRDLISKGADVTLRDQQGNTPLHIACRKGDRDAVSLIVQSFGDNKTKRAKYFSVKNCEGLTCLHVAAQQKEFIILGHLFAKGADVNIGDAKSGRTLLHYAVEKKDIETVSLLLTHPNIDVDCKTFKGETPLVLAFWRNYQDIVKRLKTKGAYFSYDVVEESDDENTT